MLWRIICPKHLSMDAHEKDASKYLNLLSPCELMHSFEEPTYLVSIMFVQRNFINRFDKNSGLSRNLQENSIRRSPTKIVMNIYCNNK